MRASVRSTFETTSGSSDVSRTTLASASAEVIDRRAEAARAGGAERLRERAAERAACLRDLGLGGARLDLEREVELRVLGEPLEQPVEAPAGRSRRRRAAAAQLDANPAPSCCRHVERRLQEPATRRWAVRPMSSAERPRYSNDVTWLAALFAAVAFAPAQPVTIAVVDTGANVRAPELAMARIATYDVRTHGRDVSDPNGHGTKVASLIARATTMRAC